MSIKLPKLYSQLDPRWKNQKLGSSNVTLGGYGCLVTTMAMLACYYGKNETPATLDTWLTQNKGYQDGNLYKWFEGLTKEYPDIKCEGLFGVPYPLNQAQEAEIDNELANKKPVVVEVDYNPMTAVLDGHWCLIVDKINGVYQIADPLEYPAKIVPITKYGRQAVTINYFVEHSGLLPNNMPDEIMQISIKDFEKIRGNSEKWDKVVSYLELPGDPATTPYDDVMNKIKGYKARETELTGKMKELEATEINLKEQAGRLKAQLTAENLLNSGLNDSIKKIELEYQKAIGLLEGRIAGLQGDIDSMGRAKGKLNERIKELEAQTGYTTILEIKALKLALVKKF